MGTTSQLAWSSLRDGAAGRGQLCTRPAARSYNVDIEEIAGPVGFVQSKGRFRARCRETGTEIVGINVEHDICLALTKAGNPDGRVRFWRGDTPSLSHSSIHTMGRYRIPLGEEFPARVKRKDRAAEIFAEAPDMSAESHETARGIHP
jgi:hypothetical protein